MAYRYTQLLTIGHLCWCYKEDQVVDSEDNVEMKTSVTRYVNV